MRSVRGRIRIGRDDDLYELTEVASLIWRLSDGTCSIPEIASAIASEYDVSSAQAEADTLAFVEEAAAAGFLEWSDAP